MVEKNAMNNKTSNNSHQDKLNKGVNDETPIVSNTDLKTKVESELKTLHSKIDLETIKQIDSKKDLSTKKKDKIVKKIYPYWVYIVKDGKPVKNFGVREETINGVKLLIRTEKINDELKVVFRELYPEPKFDTHIIDANKKRLSQELNLLKQIEKQLESELFDEGETSEYNYELSDVKISILEKEVALDSIKYGKSFRYFHEWVRDDGIPALIYEFENNGLRLKKEVKEKSLFVEASEVKQIESLESRRDIDESLKKSDSRDWKKIAYAFLWAFLLLIGTYGVFELLNYNHEREFGVIHDDLEKTMVAYNNGVKSIVDNCGKNTDPVLQSLQQILTSNQAIIESCINNNLIEGTSKPTITS